MKRKTFSIPLILFFVLSVSAQNKEARKINEFSFLPCGDLLMRADASLVEMQKEPDSKIYLIYYEGDYSNYKGEIVKPRRGEALNFTKAISFYLTKWKKVPKEKIVLVNGGYMENYEVEIWIVPQFAEPPKPTPTLEERDIQFRRGKPFRVRDCEGYYRSI